MRLQVNTSGAWQDVLTFDAARKAAIVKAAKVLSELAGGEVNWAIVHDDGRREFLALSLKDVFRGQK